MSFLVAQHPISHIKRVLKILKCCIKFEGYFDRNDTIYTHKGLVHATRSSSYLLYTSKEGYGILKQQWMPLRASYHPQFLYREGTWNLTFCKKSGSCFRQKCHGVDQKEITYAVRSFDEYLYTPKKCY